jgi:hypothetical protein
VLPIRVAEEWEEVVPVENGVDAHLLSSNYGISDRGVVGVLWWETNSDSDWMRHEAPGLARLETIYLGP